MICCSFCTLSALNLCKRCAGGFLHKIRNWLHHLSTCLSINWAFSLFFFSCFQRKWFPFFFQEKDLYLLIRISLAFKEKSAFWDSFPYFYRLPLCLTELLSITHLDLAKLIYFHECILWFLNSFGDVISFPDCTCGKLSLSALFFLIFVTWLSM